MTIERSHTKEFEINSIMDFLDVVWPYQHYVKCESLETPTPEQTRNTEEGTMIYNVICFFTLN